MELQGHRGARGVLPENSLPGFGHAIAEGMDSLELDVAMTRDNQIIITHDPGLNPDIVRHGANWVTERTPVKHLSIAELKRFDIGRIRPDSDYAKRFSEQQPIDDLRMPLLAELFALPEVKSNQILCLDIEIKTSPAEPTITFTPDKIADALLAAIDKAEMRNRCRIRSFDWSSLVHVRKIAPDIETAFLTATQPWLNNLEATSKGPSAWLGGLHIDDFDGSPPRAIHHLRGAIWAPFYGDLTEQELAIAHQLGLKVIVWTVNEQADMRRMYEMGVDGITTDYPERLRCIANDH